MAEAFRTSELDRGRGLAGLFPGPWACVWGVCLGATRAATFLIVCLTTGHFMGNSSFPCSVVGRLGSRTFPRWTTHQQITFLCFSPVGEQLGEPSPLWGCLGTRARGVQGVPRAPAMASKQPLGPWASWCPHVAGTMSDKLAGGALWAAEAPVAFVSRAWGRHEGEGNSALWSWVPGGVIQLNALSLTWTFVKF